MAPRRRDIFVSQMLMARLAFMVALMCLGAMVSSAPPAPEAPSAHHVSKRNALQLCMLIHSHTGRGCLDYNEYGCFCGQGNGGPDKKHVDEVDGCCKRHDRCYGEVRCTFLAAQFVGYSTDGCSEEEVKSGKCQCTDSPVDNACAYDSCQCDLQFAKCLARAQYNETFLGFDREKCEVNTGFGKYKHDPKRQIRKLRSKQRRQRDRQMLGRRPLSPESFGKEYMNGDVEAAKKLSYMEKKTIMHRVNKRRRRERKARRMRRRKLRRQAEKLKRESAKEMAAAAASSSSSSSSSQQNKDTAKVAQQSSTSSKKQKSQTWTGWLTGWVG